jgi:hypothetical protein
MKLLIDKKGNAGFDEWFFGSDAKDIVKALRAVRTDITIEEVDYEFKEEPILRKKDRFAAIPKTQRTVLIMLSNVDKENDEILRLLGVDRESDFVITTMMRNLEKDFQRWEKIDKTKQWKSRQESIEAFARTFPKE